MNDMQKKNDIIFWHLHSYCKSDEECFYFGYKDDADNFRFHSPYTLKELKEVDPIHNLLCINSFYINPYNANRTEKYLTTLYALNLDLDGWKYSTPLSHIDVLKTWNELGFDKDPSIIIRTSEGRFHIILWLQPLAAFPEKISYWKKCQEGLCNLFQEFGADRQPPVNFVRIPGTINYKYCNKPVVEIVYSSDSVFSLSEIHQVLQDNNVYYKKPKKVNTSLLEGIKEIEMGVRHGVTNYALYTLALHYRTQNLSKDQAIKKLMEWNLRNELPEVDNKFINTIGSAYSSNHTPSLHWINRIISRNNELELNPAPIRKPITPRIKKSDSYKEKIVNHLQEHDGIAEQSMRSLADELVLPREYLRQILKDKLTFCLQTVGKGRRSSTTIKLKNYKHKHLKLVHSTGNNAQILMTKVNDQKQGVITEEVDGVRSRD
jgi:hypothetical protein